MGFRLQSAAGVLSMASWLWAASLSGQEDCIECHDVDLEATRASIHGFLECVDCHPGADSIPHLEGIETAQCAGCHEEAGAEYADSIHGQLLATGDPLVKGCSGCHGSGHRIQSSSAPDSPTHPRRLAETCGGCHATPELYLREGIRIFRPLAAYTASVHARALEEGKKAATCATCHGSHLILRASDPKSEVYRGHISRTCGECHRAISEAYDGSVHGRASAMGVWESPTCIDCHGEHRILEPQRRDSPVYATNIPKMTCGRCHAGIHLSEKFGIPSKRVPAYEESYHGLASRAGRVTVANCASCHGVHDILPSSDPDSHIHPDHLAVTCGQCHAGAGTRFAIGPVHVLPEEPAHISVYWARIAYLWLIALTIGFMVLHNGLDFFRKVLSPPPKPAAGEVVDRERLCFGFRLAHALLLVSFVVLVYSGFALTNPEAWWASPLLAWENQFDLRGWVHRAAALLLLGAVAVHIGHLLSDREARACIARMRPGRDDWLELKGRIAFFFGRREHSPKAPWVGYAEKIEYLAVVWGTLVMALTGFALWAESAVLRWLPSWVIDLATVIHFYEAVLASLAIVVWHFYAVIFDPVVYPVDPAWLTGRSAPARALERIAPERSRPEPASLSYEDIEEGR